MVAKIQVCDALLLQFIPPTDWITCTKYDYLTLSEPYDRRADNYDVSERMGYNCSLCNICIFYGIQL